MLNEQLGEEAEEGDVRKVEELLSKGANVNARLDDGYTIDDSSRIWPP